MNYWQFEQTAEYNRQQIAEEIRAERLARKFRVVHPGRFERMMFNFANWMIATGKQLRERYEIPAVNSNRSTTRTFAN